MSHAANRWEGKQRGKDEPTAQFRGMEDLRRGNAAQPHRNRSRYSRSDERRSRQRGYDD